MVVIHGGTDAMCACIVIVCCKLEWLGRVMLQDVLKLKGLDVSAMHGCLHQK